MINGSTLAFMQPYDEGEQMPEPAEDGVAWRPEELGEEPDAPSATHGDFHHRETTEEKAG